MAQTDKQAERRTLKLYHLISLGVENLILVLPYFTPIHQLYQRSTKLYFFRPHFLFTIFFIKMWIYNKQHMCIVQSSIFPKGGNNFPRQCLCIGDTKIYIYIWLVELVCKVIHLLISFMKTSLTEYNPLFWIGGLQLGICFGSCLLPS